MEETGGREKKEQAWRGEEQIHFGRKMANEWKEEDGGEQGWEAEIFVWRGLERRSRKTEE